MRMWLSISEAYRYRAHGYKTKQIKGQVKTGSFQWREKTYPVDLYLWDVTQKEKGAK